MTAKDSDLVGGVTALPLGKRILLTLRPYIVCFLVLPISFFLSLHKAFKKRTTEPPRAQDHDQRVKRVQKQLRDARAAGAQCRSDRSGAASLSTRLADKSKHTKVKLSDFGAILKCSDGPGTITVESACTVGDMTRYLLARGLSLECCLEMEDATLGGLVLATGMTTHSHICGLIHETLVSCDVVLSSGELVHCTADNEYQDLFRALPWSHGSLGLLVALELRTVPATKVVKLTYTPLTGRKEFAQYTDACASPTPPEFLECIFFTRDTAVMITGECVDPATVTGDIPFNHMGAWYKPWYHEHVRSFLQCAGPQHEFVPVNDYLMRHDKSMCMTMASIIPFGNHPLFRYVAGWLLPPDMTLLKASHTEETRADSCRMQVFQDFAVPIDHFQETLETMDDMFTIYPVMSYGCKLSAGPGFLRGSGQFINFGLYGIPAVIKDGRQFKTITAVRRLEAHIRSVGGFAHTYCDSFQTQDEFRAMYDHTLYDEMRAKYKAVDAFPDVFVKTRPEVPVTEYLKEEETYRDDADLVVRRPETY